MISASKLALGAWLATVIVGIEAQQDPLAIVAERMNLRASVQHAGGRIEELKDVLYSNVDGEKGKGESFQEQLDAAILAASKEEDTDEEVTTTEFLGCTNTTGCTNFRENTKPYLDTLQAVLKDASDAAKDLNIIEPSACNYNAYQVANNTFNEFKNQVLIADSFDELITVLEEKKEAVAKAETIFEQWAEGHCQLADQTQASSAYQTAIDNLKETESVAFVQIFAKQIIGIPADSGSYEKTETTVTGYSTEVSLGVTLNAQVSAETGELEKLAGGSISAELAVSFSASLEFDYDQTTTTTIDIKVGSTHKNTYYYQTLVVATTNYERRLSFGGGSVITNEPVDYVASKEICPEVGV